MKSEILALAMKNLAAHRARTALALLGLMAPLLGFLAFRSAADGFSRSIRDYYGRLDGIYALRRGSPDPLFSSLPASLEEAIASLDGVRAVSPEVWCLASGVDGGVSLDEGLFAFLTVGGVDPAKSAGHEGGGVYRRSLVEGRFLKPGESGAVLVSERMAEGLGKGLGDSVEVDGRALSIAGLYRTGAFMLDSAFVVGLEDAYAISGRDRASVSSFYVSFDGGVDENAAIDALRALSPQLGAKRAATWADDFRGPLATVDAFVSAVLAFSAALTCLVSLIVMSVSFQQRTRDFGIMLCEGWRRSDAALLVLAESLALCLGAWIAGVALWPLLGAVLSAFLPFAPETGLAALGSGLAVELASGVVGALIPLAGLRGLDPAETLRTL